MVYCKRILAFLILFLMISTVCFGAQVVNPTEQTGQYTTIYDDTYFNLYLWEYNWQDAVISRLWYAKGDSNYESAVNRIFNVSLGLGNNGLSLLVLRDNESDAFTVYLVNLDAFSYSGGSIVTGTVNMNGIYFPNQKVYSGYFGKIASINSGGATAYSPSVGVSNFVASPMLGIFNPRWIDLFTYYGLIDDNTSDYNSALSDIMFNQSQLITKISQGVNAINNQTNTLTNSIDSNFEDTNEELQAVQDKIEETNDKLDDLNDTITDDSIESSATDLPSISVNDPTSSGIDDIFTSIYNAFCTGNAQDIVFPIPFTNKNITLSPYYVRDMLNNNNAGWIYTLIQAFWGYLIGRFIVSDISRKIDKIKSGNIENIENNNTSSSIHL